MQNTNNTQSNIQYTEKYKVQTFSQFATELYIVYAQFTLTVLYIG